MDGVHRPFLFLGFGLILKQVLRQLSRRPRRPQFWQEVAVQTVPARNFPREDEQDLQNQQQWIRAHCPCEQKIEIQNRARERANPDERAEQHRQADE